MQNSIGKQSIFKMSLPIFIEIFLQMLVGNVDQIMLSRYSPISVAAVGNANQIINIVIIVLTVMGIATTILITQSLGARNKDNISEVFTVSLFINFVFSLVASVFLLLFSKTLFQWLQVPSDVINEADLFLKVISTCFVFQGLYFSFIACFRSYSLMKTTMIVSCIMNIINIFGNWLLIYGFWSIPPLGILGSAISTNISKLIGLVLIYILFRKYLQVKISLNYLKPFPWKLTKKILSISLPTSGESLSYQLSQTTIMKMINIFGLVVITTKVYAYVIATFTYVYTIALSVALQVVIGYLIGAKDFETAQQKVWHTLKIALLLGPGLTTICYIFSDNIFGLFTNDAEILALGKTILFIEIFLEIGRAVNIILVRSLQAAGDIKVPVTVGISSMWIIAVGLSYILGIVYEMGLVGIWIAMATDECVRAVIFTYRWHSGIWKSKRLLET